MQNKVIKLTLILFLLIILFNSLMILASNNDKDEIIQLEKNSMDRWANGDVWGYLNLCADSITYFDESTNQKIKSRQKMIDYISPWNGKIFIHRFELVNVDLELYGNIGVLSYNLYNFNEKGDTTIVWNSTEVYKKIDANWKIVHAHWSIIDD